MNGMNTMGFLPPQHIPTAKSEESLKRLRMAPDSDVIIMHDEDPVVFICQTDSLGNMSYEAFDLVKRKTKEEQVQDQLIQTLLLINTRLDNLEARLDESVIEEPTQTTSETVTESTTNRERNEDNKADGKSQRTGRAGSK